MSDTDEDVKRVEQHANALAEHFDSVQIFVTRHEAGRKEGTVNVNLGAGNWFTRFGQVKEWILRVEEDTRLSRKPNA